jgi:hypothetical protein
MAAMTSAVQPMTPARAGRLAAWRWRLARAMQALGLPGLAGLALLAGAALSWLALTLPAAAERDRLAAQVQARAAAPALQAQAQAQDASMRLPGAAEEIQAFDRTLADPRHTARSLAQLAQAAQRQGVTLQAASFRMEPARDDGYARYLIEWPAQAEYRALRRFIAQALREQPALALQELSLQRPDPASATVQAQLRWVLFLEPAR